MQNDEQPVVTDEMINAVAERIYEDAHAGMTNIWGWNDGGLDDEHPGARERFLGYARSALTALATGSPASFTLSRAAENYVAEHGFEHSRGIIESAFEAGAKWAVQYDPAHLHKLLDERDRFIVSMGLWSEFVQSLSDNGGNNGN